MKSIILTTFSSLFIAYLSFAQPIKGNYTIGGSIGLGFSSSPNAFPNTQRTFFNFSPTFGKFISEKRQVNFGLGYSLLNQQSEQDDYNYSNITDHNFGLSLGTTRFIPLVEKIYFTLQTTISGSYGLSKSTTANSGYVWSSEFTNVTASFAISPGLTYFINSKWMVFTNIGLLNYRLRHSIDSSSTDHEVFLRGNANDFGIGVRYILGGQK